MSVGKDIGILRRLHWPMLGVTLLLVVIGVFFIFSAGYVSKGEPVKSQWERQILWAAVGFACYIGCCVLDYRKLKRLSLWFYLLCLGLLLLVPMIGVERLGARRWLDVGVMSLQPSELMKIAVILLLARVMSREDTDTGSIPLFLVLLGLVALPTLLVGSQPDLGTSMVFLPVAFIMMFIAGVPGRYLVTLAGIGVVLVGLVFTLLLVPKTEDARFETWQKLGLKEHWRERLMVFVDPDRDRQGAGWNREQSRIAVGSGGALGKGFLKGRQNTLGFVSPVIAPTDFVFTVIAEEKGFVGSVSVLVLFGYLCVAGIRMAIRTRDMFGRLLSVGITSLLFCHVFINVAMTVGVMPITGLPLPLLSYGGSFTVVMLASLGLLQGVHLRSLPRVEGFV